MSRGTFIAFEGGEGAGKTTQINALTDSLVAAGHLVTLTREPGGSLIGRKLRQILLDPKTGPIHARTEALLFAADRAEHVAFKIRPSLEAGYIVITDRYMDSSAAYQGSGRGLFRDEIIRLSMWASDGLVPDLTVVLDIDPQIGLARATKSEFGQADRIEGEQIEFAQAVRAGFLDLARQAPERYLIVDASAEPDVVAAQIRDAAARVLKITLDR